MLPNLRLEDIEAAINVTECKHFARAGAKLHLDQTTISKCVKRVERAVGAELINRSAHPVQPTKAGAIFLYWGRRGLHALTRGITEVQRLNVLDQSMLHIGYTSFLKFDVLAYILQVATRSGVGPVHRGHSSSTSEIITCVRERKWDCGFIVTPATTEGLIGVPVYEEPFGLVVTRDHPIARKRNVEIDDLHGVRLILPARERNTGFRAWFIQRCVAKGVKPIVSHEVGNPHEAWYLASQRTGLALVPRSAASNLPRGATVFRPFLEDDLRAEIQLVFRAEPQPPMLASFVKEVNILRERMRDENMEDGPQKLSITQHSSLRPRKTAQPIGPELHARSA